MVKLQKTQVKIFCVALALVFFGSVVALGLSQLGTRRLQRRRPLASSITAR